MIFSKDLEILSGVKNKKFPAKLIARLDGITKNFLYKDYWVIADKNSVRLYHPRSFNDWEKIYRR